MRCPARSCSEPSTPTGAIFRRAATTNRRAFATATAPTRPTSGATSARSYASAIGERAQEAVAYFYADRRPKAWNQWAEVVVRDAREPRFVGDMPHGWVASDHIRSVLDLFAYEDESESIPRAGCRRADGLAARQGCVDSRSSDALRTAVLDRTRRRRRRHRRPRVRASFLSARWCDLARAMGQERSSGHRWPDRRRPGRRHHPVASACRRSDRTAIGLSCSLEMDL